ncbi:MAG: hypothetical protein SWK90_15320 [Chloroflexota bacterium]|nr:hypothetical protein [Chloroflexota bacterium]
MEFFLTDLELLLLDWQLDGPNVVGILVLLVLLLLAAFAVGYVLVQLLLLKAKWSGAMQLFNHANIIIPSNHDGWMVRFVLVALILGATWWILGH